MYEPINHFVKATLLELNLVYDFSGVGLFVLAVVVVATILEYVLSMSRAVSDVEMASNNNNVEDPKKMQTKKTHNHKFGGKIAALKTCNKPKPKLR